MKIILPGGNGQVGRVLNRFFRACGHQVVVLSRDLARDPHTIQWDGRTVGAWMDAIDGADVVINLAGRSVNCRYTPANLKEMMDSRIDSARIVGSAIANAKRPPRVWLQMSTATIYAHTFGPAHDESGIIGGGEPDVPAYWKYSIDIATNWERTQAEVATPRTRKVALRSAIVMNVGRGSPFELLLGLTRLGLGGTCAGGRQYMSWIHEYDFARAVEFLIDRDDLSGPVNLASPAPLPQAEFMQALRNAFGTRIGMPATKWMLELGAFFMRSDTELILKSRRVIPGRLLKAGFDFVYPDWPAAAAELVTRWRARAWSASDTYAAPARSHLSPGS